MYSSGTGSGSVTGLTTSVVVDVDDEKPCGDLLENGRKWVKEEELISSSVTIV